MPAPAGTGLSRRSFLLRSGGLAMSVYGASLLNPKAFVDGIAKAAASQGRVLVSVFLEGGIDALSVLAPVEDPRYQQLRPDLRLGPDQGWAWSEDPRLHWHPSAKPLRDLHAEGKVTVFPGIGYSEPRPVALHLPPLLGGRTAGHPRQHGLARPAPRRDRHERQPAAGRLARRLPVAEPRDLQGSRGGDLGSELRPLGAGRLGRRRGAHVRDLRPDRGEARGAATTGALQTAGRATRQSDAAARAARSRSATRSRAPVPYPDTSISPRASPASPRCSSANLPIRCAALNAPGGYDTHDSQDGRLRPTTCKRDLRLALRLPARPRGARASQPRGDPRLVGVRPPPRAERLRTGPTTGPPATPS